MTGLRIPDDEPPRTYEDEVSELLANVADLLTKKDWGTLHRLQKALKPLDAADVNKTAYYQFFKHAKESDLVNSAIDVESGVKKALEEMYEKKILESLVETKNLFPKGSDFTGHDRRDRLGQVVQFTTYGTSTDFDTSYITRASKKLDEMDLKRAETKIRGYEAPYMWTDEVTKFRGLKKEE